MMQQQNPTISCNLNFFNYSYDMNSNSECQPPSINTLLMYLQQTVQQQNMLLQMIYQQQESEFYTQAQHTKSKDQIEGDLCESDKENMDEEKNYAASDSCFEGLKYEEDTYSPSISEEIFIKNEEENRCFFFREGTGSSQQSLCCKQEPDTEFSQEIESNEVLEESPKKKIYFKIIRRNDFKNSSSTPQDTLKKSNKYIIPKIAPSKTKHLWINYGRKIIEFALFNVTNDQRARVKQLTGKLGSKRDFIDIFGIKPTDSDDEKIFKIGFGRLALYFVEFKAESAFEDSKYKKQMVAQKKLVSSLIKQLISYSILEHKSFNFDKFVNVI